MRLRDPACFRDLASGAGFGAWLRDLHGLEIWLRALASILSPVALPEPMSIHKDSQIYNIYKIDYVS